MTGVLLFVFLSNNGYCLYLGGSNMCFSSCSFTWMFCAEWLMCAEVCFHVHLLKKGHFFVLSLHMCSYKSDFLWHSNRLRSRQRSNMQLQTHTRPFSDVGNISRTYVFSMFMPQCWDKDTGHSGSAAFYPQKVKICERFTHIFWLHHSDSVDDELEFLSVFSCREEKNNNIWCEKLKTKYSFKYFTCCNNTQVVPTIKMSGIRK